MKKRTMLIRFGFLLAVVALIAACKSEYESGGILHFTQGRFEQALENFELAIAEQPENGSAHLWMGRSLAELERDQEAVEALHKALDLDPTQAEMVDNTLGSYWSKRYNSGLASFMNALKSREAGQDAKAREELLAAQDRFERAILFEPDSVKNYMNLARVNYQLGDMDDALSLFRQAKSMSEGDARVQTQLFGIFQDLGTAALETTDRQSLETALALLGDAEQMRATPEKMAEVHFNIATAHYILTELDPDQTAMHLVQAEKYYRKVLTVDDQDPMTLENLALVLLEQGEIDQALEIGQQRLDLDPTDAEGHLLMSRLRKAAGDDRLANGHLLFVQIRSQGDDVPLADIREHASEYGPGSDMLKTLRDRGAPKEIKEFAAGFTPYEAWFYWMEGRVYVFQKGEEKFRLTFRSLTREEVEELTAS